MSIEAQDNIPLEIYSRIPRVAINILSKIIVVGMTRFAYCARFKFAIPNAFPYGVIRYFLMPGAGLSTILRPAQAGVICPVTIRRCRDAGKQRRYQTQCQDDRKHILPHNSQFLLFTAALPR
ncbi:MAG: hypothetical protein U0M31_08735 [Oscillospiraceae bacterium]|jgi:hypothetical protein|nr:hypothetical protein [Oscillospiraceae bacterium]